MIIWINGAFGSGKTTTAYELNRRLDNSFVYDPENIGYFIRKNSPKVLSSGDFQNIEMWRTANYEMFKLINDNYDGVVIAPMTLVNPEYFDEIIGKLRNDGIDVHHYILYASKETIENRLKIRRWNPKHFFKKDTFAMKSISRCLDSFDNHITDIKIMTDNKLVEDVVEEIAKLSNLVLMPDKRTWLRRKYDRYFTLLKHIRG